MTGADIRRRRLALGLTQEGLARALSPVLGRELTMNTVARWERNEQRPYYPLLIDQAISELEQARQQ